MKRGGETYLNVTEFSFNIDTKKLHLHFENLFNGNKELGKERTGAEEQEQTAQMHGQLPTTFFLWVLFPGSTMNTFLNENSHEVLKELKPAISDGFGEVFKQISNRVFSKVPLDKIFPE